MYQLRAAKFANMVAPLYKLFGPLGAPSDGTEDARWTCTQRSGVGSYYSSHEELKIFKRYSMSKEEDGGTAFHLKPEACSS